MSTSATSVRDCADNQEFYRCAIGPFTGCCSSNPCDTGVCPDDDCDGSTSSHHIAASTVAYPGLPPQGTTLVTLSSILGTKTVTVKKSTEESATGVTTGLVPTKTRSKSSADTDANTKDASTNPFKSLGSVGHITAIHPASSTDTVTHPTSSSGASHPHGPSSAAVAGIVFALLAGIAALALLLWCCCRKKSKYSVNVQRGKKTLVELTQQEPTEEQQRAQRELQERVAILVERERALRALEDRRSVRPEMGSRGPKDSSVEAHKVWI